MQQNKRSVLAQVTINKILRCVSTKDKKYFFSMKRQGQNKRCVLAQVTINKSLGCVSKNDN